jgi:hypothetical protein
MLDLSFIPGQQDNIKIFYASDTVNWQTWTKPRGCSFVWIMCIGGGAGGGSGQGTSTTTGTAGSGGGSGGITRLLYQANYLPDILYVQPGLGGAGAIGTTGVTVSAGTANRSSVSITPSSSIDQRNTVAVSGNVAATGTTAETVLTSLANSMGQAIMANFLNTPGNVGGGVAGVALSSTILCCGCGGGTIAASVASAGTSIASIDMTTMITPTISGGAATGAVGQSGIWNWKPMYGLGGAGGGANTSGAGGNGGNGAYGCGGGGGGAGSTSGGNGGRGGDGLVIIATF